MKNHKFESPNFDFEIKSNVLYVTYKGRITLKVAKEVVDNRLDFSKGNAFPILVKGVGLTNIDKEARDFLSSPRAMQGVKAGALFVDSVFNSFLGNFFLKVSKPSVPAKLFTDEKKALEWLEQFK